VIVRVCVCVRRRVIHTASKSAPSPTLDYKRSFWSERSLWANRRTGGTVWGPFLVEHPQFSNFRTRRRNEYFRLSVARHSQSETSCRGMRNVIVRTNKAKQTLYSTPQYGMVRVRRSSSRMEDTQHVGSTSRGPNDRSSTLRLT
jgi:hypothetical protein